MTRREIENLQIDDVLENIVEIYLKSEYLEPRYDELPGVSGYYQPAGIYSALPQIFINYIAKDSISEELAAEQDPVDLYNGNEVSDQGYRYERILEHVLNNNPEDILDGYKEAMLEADPDSIGNSLFKRVAGF